MTGELLRQARLHVVDHRHPEPLAQEHAREGRLLHGVNARVPSLGEPAEQLRDQGDVEQDLGEGEADGHPPQVERVRGAEIPHSGNLDRPPDRERDHVHVIRELRERLKELMHGDWSPTVFVKRLWSDHEHPRSWQRQSSPPFPDERQSPWKAGTKAAGTVPSKGIDTKATLSRGTDRKEKRLISEKL
jgi:hypothetical protein